MDMAGWIMAEREVHSVRGRMLRLPKSTAMSSVFWTVDDVWQRRHTRDRRTAKAMVRHASQPPTRLAIASALIETMLRPSPSLPARNRHASLPVILV